MNIKRILLSVAFITVCGLCLTNVTLSESKLYLAGFVVGFIAANIQGDAK